MSAVAKDAASVVGWPYGDPSPSVSVGTIAEALCAAQIEMRNPGFDATNPHFKSKFVSLAAVRNAVIPVLAKHGISVTQDLTTINGGIGCKTILTHKSGQYMAFGPLVLPPTKADAQGFGSAATYARRYSLMAIAGIVGDEDDDGNAAAAANQQAHQESAAQAKSYASRFEKAIEEGKDDLIVELKDELRGAQELELAIWAQLSAPVRRKIKDVLSASKAPA